MDNLIESLLATDSSNFQNDTKTKEIKVESLSDLTGKDFIIKVKALPLSRLYELQDKVYGERGLSIYESFKANVNILSETIVSPDLDDSKLKKHLGLNENALKIEVIKKIFKGDEINDFASQVMSLSGFNSDVKKKVKN